MCVCMCGKPFIVLYTSSPSDLESNTRPIMRFASHSEHPTLSLSLDAYCWKCVNKDNLMDTNTQEKLGPDHTSIE